jgi:hypothetical protein
LCRYHARADPLEPSTAAHYQPGRSLQLRHVIKIVMVRETVDGKFTTIKDVAAAALFFAASKTNALTGRYQSSATAVSWSEALRRLHIV